MHLSRLLTSVRSRLLLLTATAFLVLLVGATPHLREMRSSATLGVRRALLTHAEVVASRGAARIERVGALMHILISTSVVRHTASNRESCNRTLVQAPSLHRNVDAFLVVTAEGRPFDIPIANHISGS